MYFFCCDSPHTCQLTQMTCPSSACLSAPGTHSAPHQAILLHISLLYYTNILVCQVGRWLILCAPAVCSWPKGAQKCPAELSNHGVLPESAQKFTAELLLLDPAGSPNLTDCLTAIFALNCAM